MRPVNGGHVTCPYWMAGPWDGGHHRGIDFGGLPVGYPVRAMWGGKVIDQSWGPAYGNHIVIDHDRLPDGSPGYWAVYAHLSKKTVVPGQRVLAGQKIGELGDTGHSTGPHLHAEIQTGPRWRPASAGNVSRDPQPWIDAEEEDVMSSRWSLKYSGKPSGELALPMGAYRTLDAKVPAAPYGGTREDRLVYLNVDVDWKNKDKDSPDYYGQIANLRVRWTRTGKTPDPTAYQDYTITPIKPSFLITHVHWETGEKGVGGHWDMRLDGPHSNGAMVGTRYCKDATEKPS